MLELEIQTLPIKILTQNQNQNRSQSGDFTLSFKTSFLLSSLCDLQTCAVLGLFVVVHKMMRHYCRDLNSRKLKNSSTPS